jgi:hypothetical protein
MKTSILKPLTNLNFILIWITTLKKPSTKGTTLQQDKKTLSSAQRPTTSHMYLSLLIIFHFIDIEE